MKATKSCRSVGRIIYPCYFQIYECFYKVNTILVANFLTLICRKEYQVIADETKHYLNDILIS